MCHDLGERAGVPHGTSTGNPSAVGLRVSNQLDPTGFRSPAPSIESEGGSAVVVAEGLLLTGLQPGGNELVFGVNLHVVLLANNVFGRASAAVGPLHSLGRT
jgi:hypothetical protein